jgi:hypothetical protein
VPRRFGYPDRTQIAASAPPRAGGGADLTAIAEPNADGSTTIYFARIQPAGVKRGN